MSANMKRIARARRVVKVYKDAAYGVPQAPHEPLGQAIGDLITDLLHLAHAKGLDTGSIVRIATDHFGIETGQGARP